MYTFYEFFAGGGMARLGLGSYWTCLFANDFSSKKAAVYRANFPERPQTFRLCDLRSLTTGDLPGYSDLVWGSFPCQDLSLAGNGAGLEGGKSGVFWPFIDLVERLGFEGRAPAIVVLENVEGAVTSREGKDFSAIVQTLVEKGYSVGAIMVDAAQFLPQSRARLFFIAVRADYGIPDALRYRSTEIPLVSNSLWHSDGLRTAYSALNPELKGHWIWWRMPTPQPSDCQLEDLLGADGAVSWHSRDVTDRLLCMMSEVHLEKVQKAMRMQKRVVGTVYKRTRAKIQRAEVRFDGISGCLRTPGGGSSRQTILLVDGSSVRSRLLSAREAARLMGLPETYLLPESYNDAYHVAGDGLAVPVVSWIERHLLRPLLDANRPSAIMEQPISISVERRVYA